MSRSYPICPLQRRMLLFSLIISVLFVKCRFPFLPMGDLSPLIDEQASSMVLERIEQFPSPRVIKSHLPLYLLPPQLIDNCKVLFSPYFGFQVKGRPGQSVVALTWRFLNRITHQDLLKILASQCSLFVLVRAQKLFLATVYPRRGVNYRCRSHLLPTIFVQNMLTS